MSKAQIMNRKLEAFKVLIGEWKTAGSHPGLPGVVLSGRTSFEWLEGGAFVIMHSHIDHKDVPDGIAIFGSDDSLEDLTMIYFDERNISRKCGSSLKNNVWKWWRIDNEFSQRYTCEIQDDGKKIVAKGEMSRKGGAWEKDLELTYLKL